MNESQALEVKHAVAKELAVITGAFRSTERDTVGFIGQTLLPLLDPITHLYTLYHSVPEVGQCLCLLLAVIYRQSKLPA